MIPTERRYLSLYMRIYIFGHVARHSDLFLSDAINLFTICACRLNHGELWDLAENLG